MMRNHTINRYDAMSLNRRIQNYDAMSNDTPSLCAAGGGDPKSWPAAGVP